MPNVFPTFKKQVVGQSVAMMDDSSQKRLPIPEQEKSALHTWKRANSDNNWNPNAIDRSTRDCWSMRIRKMKISIDVSSLIQVQNSWVWSRKLAIVVKYRRRVVWYGTDTLYRAVRYCI